jgi:hypothetical protein
MLAILCWSMVGTFALYGVAWTWARRRVDREVGR